MFSIFQALRRLGDSLRKLSTSFTTIKCLRRARLVLQVISASLLVAANAVALYLALTMKSSASFGFW